MWVYPLWSVYEQNNILKTQLEVIDKKMGISDVR